MHDYLSNLLERRDIDQRVDRRGAQAHTGGDIEPADIGEEFAVLRHDPPGALEQRHLLYQRIGQLDIADMIPEGLALALVGIVMQQQEIADVRVFAFDIAVVAVDQHRVEAAIGEQVEQAIEPGVDEMDAGGFERLEKPRRQAEREAIADPHAFAQPRGKTQHARIGNRRTAQTLAQFFGRVVIPDEVAAIDEAIARPVLERNTPLPPRRSRGGHRVGRANRLRSGRCGDRAVAG